MPRTVFYFLEKYSKKTAALGVRTQAFLLTRTRPNQLDCNEKYSIKTAALGFEPRPFYSHAHALTSWTATKLHRISWNNYTCFILNAKMYMVKARRQDLWR
jgi:hypothetical protein